MTLLDSLQFRSYIQWDFISIFPGQMLKNSFEAFHFLQKHNKNETKIPWVPKITLWLSLALCVDKFPWKLDRHKENSNTQQRVFGINFLLLLTNILHFFIWDSPLKFQLWPAKKRNIMWCLCNYLDSTGFYAWTFLWSQRIPVHLLVSISKNEITMRALSWGFFSFMYKKYISTNKYLKSTIHNWLSAWNSTTHKTCWNISLVSYSAFQMLW